jgi:hypothetical protein
MSTKSATGIWRATVALFMMPRVRKGSRALDDIAAHDRPSSSVVATGAMPQYD